MKNLLSATIIIISCVTFAQQRIKIIDVLDANFFLLQIQLLYQFRMFLSQANTIMMLN